MSSPTPVVLQLPFHGRWTVQNSPAHRVPSHGTPLFGTSHAIDFVPVGDDDRSAPRTWRTLLSTEAPERFVGFGRPVLAPIDGRVAQTHDGELDHRARRSGVSLLPYALGQARRVRAGIDAVAGNRVVIDAGHERYVAVVHLQRGSVAVQPGERVRSGQLIGSCGNSGNSTEPHVHLQVSDSLDWPSARGVPLAFARPSLPPWVPADGEVVTG